MCVCMCMCVCVCVCVCLICADDSFAGAAVYISRPNTRALQVLPSTSLIHTIVLFSRLLAASFCLFVVSTVLDYR
jgi:hypothetical protein